MVQRLHKGFICPVFLTLVASGAFHAPAHGADVILEEVVVTARKRGAESIQDIGGSIQVLSGEAFSETAATGFSDYMRQVPSLSANTSGIGQAQLAMRGITATRLNHSNPNIPSTVALYLDETPVSTSGFNPDASLFDVNRVEVLRGPQGTLFGASSMSGMIRLIPNEPSTEEFTASANLSAFDTTDGSGSYSGHGIVNVPVNDSLAVRALLFNVSNGGFIDNVYNGEEDYNEDDTVGGRLMGLWNATDSLTAKATFMFQNSESTGRPQEQRLNDPVELTTVNNGYDLALPSESASQFIITGERQNSKFVNDTFDDEFYLASLQLDLARDQYSVTSITSYFDREMDNLLDDTRRVRDLIGVANSFGASGQPVFALGDFDPVTLDGAIFLDQVGYANKTRNDKFTQELRVNSNLDGPLAFVAGLYYENDSRRLDQLANPDGLDAWIASPNDLDGFFGSSFGSPLENAYFDGTFDVDTTQFAVFAEVSYQFGDFELSGGGRFFDYEQAAFIRWQGWVEFSDDLLDEKTSETGFNPRVEVLYRPSDEMTLYAKAAKGFRVGSVQQFINPAFCSNNLADLGITEVPTTIEGDSLWNYEAGAKTTLFGGTTTANLSVYQMDWENARTQDFLPCGWIVEYSIVDIVARGVELEIFSQPTDRLALNFAAGYNNSEVDGSLDPSGPQIAADGDRAPFAPEWTVNAGFRYQVDKAFNEADWYVRGDISYVGSQFNELGTLKLERIEIPSNTVLNLYSGLTRDNWELGVFIRNLTDERIVMGADTDRQRPAQLAIGRPRNFGFQVTYNFAGD